MAKWVTEELKGLLHKINNVANDDQREGKQLSLLMNGFSRLNSMVMDRAAEKTLSQLGELNLKAEDDTQLSEAQASESQAEQPAAQQGEKIKDSSSDELTKLRPIR